MTEADLHTLRDEHAFDPAPFVEELYRYHVPFDELVGKASCEKLLRLAIQRGEQVALVGDSGSGKSSVIGHVLGPLVEGVAPLPVQVAVDAPELAGDPVRFAGHVVQTVARYVEYAMPGDAHRAKKLADNSTPTIGGTTRRRKFGGSIGWLSARVELATELEQVTTPQPRSGREIIDQAVAILQLITEHKLQPVLVFDDTDRWFGAGVADAERLLEGFFGRVVRLIAEDLAVTAVLAVHNGYLDHPAYAQAAGFIESTIRIPRLPDSTALGRLLSHRTQGHQVLTADALLALFAYYDDAATSNLRQRVLLIVHTALSHACDEGADQIGTRHIELAIAEYGGGSSGRRWGWPRRK